jgi:3-isopropylmalate/(R)-2-methylmalate dehydratase small subunit
MDAADRDDEITVDLEAETISAEDGPAFSFSLPPLRRTALLEGLSDLELALRLSKAVDDFEVRDRRARPWAHRSRPRTA